MEFNWKVIPAHAMLYQRFFNSNIRINRLWLYLGLPYQISLVVVVAVHRCPNLSSYELVLPFASACKSAKAMADGPDNWAGGCHRCVGEVV